VSSDSIENLSSENRTFAPSPEFAAAARSEERGVGTLIVDNYQGFTKSIWRSNLVA